MTIARFVFVPRKSILSLKLIYSIYTAAQIRTLVSLNMSWKPQRRVVVLPHQIFTKNAIVVWHIDRCLFVLLEIVDRKYFHSWGQPDWNLQTIIYRTVVDSKRTSCNVSSSYCAVIIYRIGLFVVISLYQKYQSLWVNVDLKALTQKHVVFFELVRLLSLGIQHSYEHRKRNYTFK